MSMKKATKAALYSALIFPGAGLLWLKQYTRACVFIMPTIAALWYLVSLLYNAIMPVYSKMLHDAEEGILVVDSNTVTAIYLKLSQDVYSSIAAMQSQLHIAQTILIAAWLCSIISSYFVGKKIDLAESTTKYIAQKTDA